MHQEPSRHFRLHYTGEVDYYKLDTLFPRRGYTDYRIESGSMTLFCTYRQLHQIIDDLSSGSYFWKERGIDHLDQEKVDLRPDGDGFMRVYLPGDEQGIRMESSVIENIVADPYQWERAMRNYTRWPFFCFVYLTSDQLKTIQDHV